MSFEISLSFKGADADGNLLDFYDAGSAVSGFQRTLALTTHLVFNGEIITQAPSLRGARILSKPFEEGSWRATAVIVGTLALSGSVASRDSVLGHIFTSIYDYVISESLGFHVDFEKSLGELIEEAKAKSDQVPKALDQGKVEALIEKLDSSIKDMHRPIFASRSAMTAEIGRSENGDIFKRTGPVFDIETFEYINVTNVNNSTKKIKGKISSYNSNTFKGRVYVENEGRPIPFTLAETARNGKGILKIVNSLSSNAVARFDGNADIYFDAFFYESKSGKLKGYLIVEID